MAKIFSVLFTADEDLPKSKGPITIQANQLYCQRIKLASEGRVTQLVVVEGDGGTDGFLVELLKSKVPYPPDAGQNIPFTPLGDVPLYRVCPQQTGISGIMELTRDQMGYPYLNFDGSNTDNQPFLYLVIIPGAAGVGVGSTTTWDVAITTERDVG